MITKAIETTGIVEAHQLLLDEPLPIMGKSHVRVIILVTEEPKKVILSQSKDYVSKLAGLHKEIWQGIDTDHYLQQERNAWE